MSDTSDDMEFYSSMIPDEDDREDDYCPYCDELLDECICDEEE